MISIHMIQSEMEFLNKELMSLKNTIDAHQLGEDAELSSVLPDKDRLRTLRREKTIATKKHDELQARLKALQRQMSPAEAARKKDTVRRRALSSSVPKNLEEREQLCQEAKDLADSFLLKMRQVFEKNQTLCNELAELRLLNARSGCTLPDPDVIAQIEADDSYLQQVWIEVRLAVLSSPVPSSELMDQLSAAQFEQNKWQKVQAMRAAEDKRHAA